MTSEYIIKQCSDPVLQRGSALPCSVLTQFTSSLTLSGMDSPVPWMFLLNTTSAKPTLNSSLQQHNVAWHDGTYYSIAFCAVVKACQQFHYRVLFLAICNFSKNKSIYSAALI